MCSEATQCFPTCSNSCRLDLVSQGRVMARMPGVGRCCACVSFLPSVLLSPMLGSPSSHRVLPQPWAAQGCCDHHLHSVCSQLWALAQESDPSYWIVSCCTDCVLGGMRLLNSFCLWPEWIEMQVSRWAAKGLCWVLLPHLTETCLFQKIPQIPGAHTRPLLHPQIVPCLPNGVLSAACFSPRWYWPDTWECVVRRH